MAGTTLNYERAAMVLVTATYLGEREAAKRYKLHEQTVRKYQIRLNTDPKLLKMYKDKKEKYESDWVEMCPIAIREGINYLLRALQDLDTSKPENLHAVMGAIKIVTEVGLAKEIVDVKLRRLSLPHG